MDKITYLAELAEGLARWVPERERQDILRYYAEYFEEAGPEREAEVVAELGDPWALSSRLAVEGGFVTREKAASWTPKKRWPVVLLGTAVGLTVFALVFGIGLLAINVVRGVNGIVTTATEFGQAYVVENPVRAEFGFVPVDEPGSMGYYLMEGKNVASFHSIDIDVGLGNIQVVAGDGFTLSVSRSEALIGYEPSCEIRDGVLRLRDGELSSWSAQTGGDSWDNLKELFRVGQWVMDVIITVPENAILDKISVKTGLGNVLVYGVCSDSVTADTGLGNVECYEARNVGWLGLSTGMGDVVLEMEEVRTGLNIGLKSGTGSVEASLACQEGDCAYTLESGLSLVSVNGVARGSSAERKGNALCRLDAASGTGSVSVYFTYLELEPVPGFFFGQAE